MMSDSMLDVDLLTFSMFLYGLNFTYYQYKNILRLNQTKYLLIFQVINIKKIHHIFFE